MKFKDLLEKAIAQNNSLLCVGLDPEPQKFSKKLSIFQFNKSIIDQTSDSVCAYKPNSAFYEAQGIKRLNKLKKKIN